MSREDTRPSNHWKTQEKHKKKKKDDRKLADQAQEEKKGNQSETLKMTENAKHDC